ncbi:hybrid sensor histidine kinase/response regulator transcription factor [Reichenbachiella versicolor]|uniref:hybrid sensor histidine kinase/response regulator transcription factor n=1 Tax=Reichenbachiella versicolor TaxID=1821036 RepID=UPI0013A5AB6F|nr:hybrid sensor histidine kinase/response regulator transcription factor [Reichenbachiella versicolor]
MKIFLSIVLMLLCWVRTALSSDGFERITSDDGLSQNDVLSIIQDSKGFIWLGTNDGLNRYDGYRFQKYSIGEEKGIKLSSNIINSIREDRHGNLWIGTTGQGLNYFDRQKNKITYLKTTSKNRYGNISNDYIQELLIQGDTVWVGSKGGLDMLVYDNKKEKYAIENVINKQQVGRKGVLALEIDNVGRIYAGCINGVHVVESGTNEKLRAYKLLELFNVNDILFKNGELLFANTQGIHVGSINKGFKRLYKYPITNLCDYQNDTFWGGNTRGLHLFKHVGSKIQSIEHFSHENDNSASLSSNNIKELFMDYTGLLWVGTIGGGVSKYDVKGQKFQYFKKGSEENSISHNNIQGFAKDSENNLWIATRGGGVNIVKINNLDKGIGDFQRLKITEFSACVTEVNTKKGKAILVGTSNNYGPYIITHDTSEKSGYAIEQFKYFEGGAFTIIQDQDSVIWFGTHYTGLVRYDPLNDGVTRFTIDSHGMPSNIVRSLLLDSYGNLWIGTDMGLVMISRSDKSSDRPKIKVYRNDPEDPSSLSHSYVLSLFEDSKGNIWVGTYGGGFDLILDTKSKGKFKNYSTNDGLSNNTIKGILEDEQGNLWISTNLGISKFSPETEVFSSYDKTNGLQGNEFQDAACIKLDDGQLLFGGINGFNMFHPEEIVVDNTAPKVAITAFSLWNQDVQAGEEIGGRKLLDNDVNHVDEIKLRYNENSVSFEFAALHYSSPLNNKYQYRLKGLEEEWISESADRRFVNYTNLPSGRYVFQVKGSNNDGVWSEEIAEVKFEIAPIFWKTIRAFLLYVVILLLIAVVIAKVVMSRRTLKKRELMSAIERDKEDAIHNMKIQFFTNISHEFRTPLTLINGPLEYLYQNDDRLTKEQRHSQYALMKKNSSVLMKLVNQVLDFRKVESGNYELEYEKRDIVSFIDDIAKTFFSLARNKGVDFKVNLPQYSVNFYFSADAIEKIVYNLLSNAFKFNKEGGVVELSIKISDDLFAILIRDTGDGIPTESRSKLFDRFFHTKNKVSESDHSSGIGLSLTKHLVELHHGTIELDEAYKQGARFIVKIPMNQDNYQHDIIVEKDLVIETVEAIENGMSEYEEELKPIPAIKKSLAQGSLPTVLLVEDSEDMRLFIKEGLSNQFDIVEAANGHEGLEILERQMPTLIISDIMMPIMDGIEFAEKVKASKAYNHIPFIFLTAKTSDESQLDGLQRGVDDYITKPFNMNILIQKLNNILTYRSMIVEEFKAESVIQPSEIEMVSPDKDFLDDVMSILEDNLMDSEFNVDALVARMGMSRSHFYHKFKDLTGMSGVDYIRRFRLTRAKQYLDNTELNIKEVMFKSGFSSTSYFAKCFKKQFGVSPSEYKKR